MRRTHLLTALTITAALTANATHQPPTPPPGGPTTMWVWDNPIPTTIDARGTGYTPAAPDTLAQFAATHTLRTVYLSAPWQADDNSAIDTWLDETVTVLHGVGIRDVGVVGGSPDWLDNPTLAAQWAMWALADRPVHHVQLEVEPWTTPQWTTSPTATAHAWLAVIDTVRAALPPDVTLGIAVPYWLNQQHTPDGTNLLDAALTRADSAVVVAYFDTEPAIVEHATAAIDAAVAHNVPFTIAVETDTPDIAGGPQYTFGDDPHATFNQHTRALADELAGREGFSGVAVEHYRSWRALAGL